MSKNQNAEPNQCFVKGTSVEKLSTRETMELKGRASICNNKVQIKAAGP